MMYFIILANSAGPDEMQHDAAFHLGLHCLPKYPFRGFQYTRGLSCHCTYFLATVVTRTLLWPLEC